MGCFAQDTPLIAPMPNKWKVSGEIPRVADPPHSPVSLLWKLRLPMQTGWVPIFDNIMRLVSSDCAFNTEQMMLASTSGS